MVFMQSNCGPVTFTGFVSLHPHSTNATAAKVSIFFVIHFSDLKRKSIERIRQLASID